jgi:hypothetical protein
MNLSALFLKANATRNKRYIASLTATPVKAAFRDTQKLGQVTKGKRTSEAKQEAPFNNPERDSKKKRKIARKIQTDCVDEHCGETFCLVSMDTHGNSVEGEIWVQCIQCQMWAHEKCTSGFPGDIFVPTASRMYQMKISEVLWAYIYLYRVSFSYVICNVCP